ncbi:prolyl oligopeptidase-like protein [Bisporella sp. PMI_857]|nr:prolyl oligopeptidase-like protein [Bisporella sp. PMI_857]
MAEQADTFVKSSSYRNQKKTIAGTSILEKLDVIPALLTTWANVFASLFTGPIRSKETKGSGPFYRYVALTAMRTTTRRASPKQIHYLMDPTDDAYLAACKKRGFSPKSEVLGDGTQAHWIGDSNADKLVLNFHGGGYVVPASPEMFEFMFQIVDALKSQGKSAAVLMLSYDLAPTAPYPRQLQQAAALLQHVLTTLSVSPSRIILTGDSAGANLATSLLSHISHPHPSSSIPRISLPDNENFAGAVLISPWVSFDTSDASFTANEYKDVIGIGALQQWSSAFLDDPYPHTKKSDFYNHAVNAPESWWENLKIDRVLIVAGAEEVLLDGINKFVKKFTDGLGSEKVETIVVQGEYHDQPNIDLQIGYTEKQEGKQAKLIKNWISSRL